MPNENRIGALWRPKTENPKAPALKGNIDVDGKKIQIVVWKNRYKEENPKRPDFIIEIDHNKRPDATGSAQNGFEDDIPF